MTYLYCDESNIYPLEHLYKSIHLMEHLPEMGDIVAELKKRMATIFLELPIQKNGHRKIRCHSQKYIEYRHDGYCKMTDLPAIILDEWEPVQVSSTYNISIKYVRDIYLPLYIQLGMYLKKPVRVHSDISSIAINKVLTTYNNYWSLSEENMQAIDYGKIIDKMSSVITNTKRLFGFGYNHYRHYERPDSAIVFFTEDEIKNIYDTILATYTVKAGHTNEKYLHDFVWYPQYTNNVHFEGLTSIIQEIISNKLADKDVMFLRDPTRVKGDYNIWFDVDRCCPSYQLKDLECKLPLFVEYLEALKSQLESITDPYHKKVIQRMHVLD